jgi:Flp pilus assembly protein TadD
MLGTTLRQLGRLEDAKAALREAIRLNPNTPGPYNTLGQILRAQGDVEGSKAAFAEAARIQKLRESEQAAMFNVNTGLAKLEAGRLEEAEEQLRLAVRAAPHWHRAFRYLAEVLQKRGKTAEAQQLLARARELEQQNVSSYLDAARRSGFVREPRR